MARAGVGKRLEISEEDRASLERVVRASSSEVRMVERARIVLAAGEGLTTQQIARRVGCGRVHALAISSARVSGPCVSGAPDLGASRRPAIP